MLFLLRHATVTFRSNLEFKKEENLPENNAITLLIKINVGWICKLVKCLSWFQVFYASLGVVCQFLLDTGLRGLLLVWLGSQACGPNFWTLLFRDHCWPVSQLQAAQLTSCLGQSLEWGCPGGGVTAPLASTDQMPVAPSPPAVTIKMSPAVAKCPLGQNCPSWEELG